jgi:ABC-2 type transport system ATP-binding protein
MSSIIKTTALSKWFGEIVAVNNLELDIGPGVTGLLGPNGAGKSTFMKLALGLYAPSRGTIEVLGAPPRNNLDVLRRIAYCPETDTFYENLTGYEFVYWLNRYWGMRHKDAARATEAACDLVHMTERMHDPIDEYSKGMRQRIKIAQALTRQSELLLLDEPMNGLDPQGREEMFALIRRLGDEGHSVIVSSHILYEVERATDNVVLIYNGAVLAQGRVREIRDLIDKHPHTIDVQSSAPRIVAKLLSEDHGIMSIEFREGGLTLRTRAPQSCYAQLNQLVLDKTAPIESITCADDNLQAVFDYLVAG